MLSNSNANKAYPEALADLVMNDNRRSVPTPQPPWQTPTPSQPKHAGAQWVWGGASNQISRYARFERVAINNSQKVSDVI